MHQDDRIFTIVGFCVTVSAAAFLLWPAANSSSPLSPDKARPNPVVATSPVIPDGNGSEEPAEYALANLPAAKNPGNRPVEEAGAGQPEDEQILRQVLAMVEAIASGTSPELEVDFLPALSDVLVRGDGQGRMVVAAGTFASYKPAVAAIAAIDPVRLVTEWRNAEVVIADVFREVRRSHGDFEQSLGAAINHLLAVEIPDQPLEMESRVTYWAFADDRYEDLSAAQRHLLLMGKDNAEKVQAKLSELRRALARPEPSQPSDLRTADLQGSADCQPAEYGSVTTEP